MTTATTTDDREAQRADLADRLSGAPPQPVITEDERRFHADPLGAYCRLVALVGGQRGGTTSHDERERAHHLLTRMMGCEFTTWSDDVGRRYLNSVTATAGGYSMPSTVTAQILAAVGRQSIIRPRAKVIEMESLNELVPSIDEKTQLSGFDLEWIRDGQGELPEADCAFRGTLLKANPLGGIVSVGRSLLQNSNSLGTYMETLLGDAAARLEDKEFINGNGLGRPLGFVRGNHLVSEARASASAFTLADLAKAWVRSPAVNRRRSIWLVTRTADDELLATTAASGSVVNPAGVYGPDAGLPGAESPSDYLLFGRPAFVSEYLPPLNSDGDVMLVDPTRYLIGDLRIELAASEHASFRDGKILYRFLHYVAGAPMASPDITMPDGSPTANPFVSLGTA